jgi:hypothetical protein
MNGSSQLPTAKAEVIAKRFTAAISLIVLDLTDAYPASTKCLRAIMLHRHDLYVIDEIERTGDCESIAWQMHTTGLPEVSGNRARIQCTGAGGTPECFYGRIVEPSDARFSIESATPTGPAGQNPNDGISKLVVKFTNPIAPLRLVVALTPEEAGEDATLPKELARPLAHWRKTTAAPRGAPVLASSDGPS